MSKRVIKTILSPVIFAIVFLMTAFCVSAETNDEVFFSDNPISADERKSDDADSEQENTLPNMKAAYYTAKASTEDTPEADSQDPTSATGATSSVSTGDSSTEESATPEEITSSGVVSTSDASENVFILMGMTAGLCLLIALHKKNLMR